MRKRGVSLLRYWGASSSNYETYEPPTLQFDEFPTYSSNVEQLTPIEQPNFLYVKIVGDNLEILPPGREDESTHVIFEPSEFRKVSALVDRAITYRDMVKKEEEVINKNIDAINRYLGYLEMERELTRQYYFMWQDVRETYAREKISQLHDPRGARVCEEPAAFHLAAEADADQEREGSEVFG